MAFKNITLSANESLIAEARRSAGEERTTLNALFRQWLQNYVCRGAVPDRYRTLMDRLGYANAGRRFSREESNER
jgi:hypothetical protein